MSEVDGLRADIAERHKRLGMARDKIDRLVRQNGMLTEALEKYADEDNWDRYTFVYQEFLGEQLAEETLRAAKGEKNDNDQIKD